MSKNASGKTMRPSEELGFSFGKKQNKQLVTRKQSKDPRDVKIQTNTYINRNKLETVLFNKKGQKCLFRDFKEPPIKLINLSSLFCILLSLTNLSDFKKRHSHNTN